MPCWRRPTESRLYLRERKYLVGLRHMGPMLRRRAGSCAGPGEAGAKWRCCGWWWLAQGSFTCLDWHKVHSANSVRYPLVLFAGRRLFGVPLRVLRSLPLPFVYCSLSPFHPRLDQLSLVSLFHLPFSLYLYIFIYFFVFVSLPSYRQPTIDSFRTVCPSFSLHRAPTSSRPLHRKAALYRSDSLGKLSASGLQYLPALCLLTPLSVNA
ncbi:hypothetical protein V1527DRAFT_222974 [Lipomyces starkeyi]